MQTVKWRVQAPLVPPIVLATVERSIREAHPWLFVHRTLLRDRSEQTRSVKELRIGLTRGQEVPAALPKPIRWTVPTSLVPIAILILKAPLPRATEEAQMFGPQWDPLSVARSVPPLGLNTKKRMIVRIIVRVRKIVAQTTLPTRRMTTSAPESTVYVL